METSSGPFSTKLATPDAAKPRLTVHAAQRPNRVPLRHRANSDAPAGRARSRRSASASGLSSPAAGRGVGRAEAAAVRRPNGTDVVRRASESEAGRLPRHS